MIHFPAVFILPLMHHLVQQRGNRLIPTMIPDMPPAYHDLGTIPLLTTQRVMSQPPLHPARHSNRNVRKLPSELQSIELAMRTSQRTRKLLVCWMSPLPPRSGRGRRRRPLEIER